MKLRDQAQYAKIGIYATHGMLHECPVVAVSDGLSIAHPGMRFSLLSRELIAGNVEVSTRGHQWNGMPGIGACDKNLAGLMMGMVSEAIGLAPSTPCVHDRGDRCRRSRMAL